MVRGRVQGVGFRAFAQREAHALGLTGWVRNHSSGDVEVYAIGTAEQLSTLASRLWKGPRWAEVSDIDEQEAPLEQFDTFHIRT
ncbi:MAG: acylphosphatase [Acidobacteriota bacterium]|nr:acylphosphatase [Acidobacteriota bacterium]